MEANALNAHRVSFTHRALMWILDTITYFSPFSVDSIVLLEAGFNVKSIDASDKMLKYALKSRWLRRKEPIFDKWGRCIVYICIYYIIDE